MPFSFPVSFMIVHDVKTTSSVYPVSSSTSMWVPIEYDDNINNKHFYILYIYNLKAFVRCKYKYKLAMARNLYAWHLLCILYETISHAFVKRNLMFLL